MRVVPLGAGQDVGRSCILVTVGSKNIMFDCGMHMGYNDERRFPDFKYIGPDASSRIDAVIISHFHLDHCGALPAFTELHGYDGPIYMTYPTRAIVPILLEDYRKIMVERHGGNPSRSASDQRGRQDLQQAGPADNSSPPVFTFFTSEDIKNCMKKVIPLNLHQTVLLDGDCEIRPYYAGHVLGAAMFYVCCGGESVIYTGDYNMTPDRHLGAASIDRLRPDLLITETTYATTIRDSKRIREREFLREIHRCVDRGGKILIPVFALGRAQELCILLETYWERVNLTAPIYFSAGMVEKANYYYQLFIQWTNQKIKDTFATRNLFDFRHIRPFDRSCLDRPGPCVIFATPGMLHAGMSLEVFKRLAPGPENMVIIPGYCVKGTVGNKLLTMDPATRTIELDRRTSLRVELQVRYLSFSAHADARGILQLIRQADPQNVCLVHGEKEKMALLCQKVESDLKIPCFYPGNGATVDIQTTPSVPIELSKTLLALVRSRQQTQAKTHLRAKDMPVEVDGVFVAERVHPAAETIAGALAKAQGMLPAPHTGSSAGLSIRLVDPSEYSQETGLVRPQLKLQRRIGLRSEMAAVPAEVMAAVAMRLKLMRRNSKTDDNGGLMEVSHLAKSESCDVWNTRTLSISWLPKPHSMVVTAWHVEDDTLAETVLNALLEALADLEQEVVIIDDAAPGPSTAV